MRVKLHSLYAGPLGSFGPGVCEVPAEIAEPLIEAGVAEAVASVKSAPVETETADAVVDEEIETNKIESPSQRGKKVASRA